MLRDVAAILLASVAALNFHEVYVTKIAEINTADDAKPTVIATEPFSVPQVVVKRFENDEPFNYSIRTPVVKSQGVLLAGYPGLRGSGIDSYNFIVHFGLKNQGDKPVILRSHKVKLYPKTDKPAKRYPIRPYRFEIMNRNGIPLRLISPNGNTEELRVIGVDEVIASDETDAKAGLARRANDEFFSEMHTFSVAPGSIVVFTIKAYGPFEDGGVCHLPLEWEGDQSLRTYVFDYAEGYAIKNKLRPSS
jgi:hypothetical protein